MSLWLVVKEALANAWNGGFEHRQVIRYDGTNLEAVRSHNDESS